MKRLSILIILICSVTLSFAVERKSIYDVVVDDLITDTQITPDNVNDDHFALVWWIPNEFWEAVLSQDASVPNEDTEAMLDVLSGVSLLAIVQADISPFGAFDFYSKDEVEQNLISFFTNGINQQQRLSLMKEINPDLEIIINMLKPVLESAMGNFGNNLHFYVLDDLSRSKQRILDPYKEGLVEIKLLQRDGNLMTAKLEMPLNSLYIPRKCPNGMDAHISWNYCPWTGVKLSE